MTLPNFSKKKTLLVFIVLVPMVIAIVYYLFFAMDRYVSRAQVVVRQPGQESDMQSIPAAALLMGGINPTSREETLYLSEYITSNDMLDILEEKLNWHEHY